MKLLLVLDAIERRVMLEALEIALEGEAWSSADRKRARRLRDELERAPILEGTIKRG